VKQTTVSGNESKGFPRQRCLNGIWIWQRCGLLSAGGVRLLCCNAAVTSTDPFLDLYPTPVSDGAIARDLTGNDRRLGLNLNILILLEKRKFVDNDRFRLLTAFPSGGKGGVGDVFSSSGQVHALHPSSAACITFPSPPAIPLTMETPVEITQVPRSPKAHLRAYSQGASQITKTSPVRSR
jgi:hypothetical protein